MSSARKSRFNYVYNLAARISEEFGHRLHGLLRLFRKKKQGEQVIHLLLASV